MATGAVAGAEVLGAAVPVVVSVLVVVVGSVLAVVVVVVVGSVLAVVVVVVLVEVSEGPPQAVREAARAMLAAAKVRF